MPIGFAIILILISWVFVMANVMDLSRHSGVDFIACVTGLTVITSFIVFW